MPKNPVPAQVTKFFNDHPKANKYNRAENGLPYSYVRKQNGNHTRIENNQTEDYVRGSGAFGRVKRSESDGQETVMKIQTKPFDEDPDLMAGIREDLEHEAEINLDFGIAIEPLIERVDLSKKRVKYYQEMIPLNETLESRAQNATPAQRINMAIDYLLLVDACHCGELTQSGNGYMHGDLSSKNAMYDQQGKLRLIDFAFSEVLENTHQLYGDYKGAMRTVYHRIDKDDDNPMSLEEPATILSQEQFNAFPIHLQKALSWEKSLRPDIQPQQLFPFITAVLISYTDNPGLSEQNIEDLKADPYKQIMIIEQYKRKAAILELPTAVAERALDKIMSKLERYKRFLDKKSELEHPSISTEDKALFVQKREVIAHLVESIIFLRDFDKSPQDLLSIIDKDLLENEELLSPNAGTESRGVIDYLQRKLPSLSGNLDTGIITNKIDKKIGRNSYIYRDAMREQRERSGTPASSLSSDTDSRSATPDSLSPTNSPKK